MKRTILLDVDEVMRDCIGKTIELYNKEFGTELTKQDITDWDLTKFLTEHPYPIKYYFKDRAKEVFTEANPLEPNLEYVVSSLANNFYIHIATSQSKGTEQYTLDWLHNHNIPYTSISFTEDKYLLSGYLGIDDKPETLNKYKEVGILPVVYNTPWNQELPYYRINSLTEFDKQLNFLNRR